MMETVLQSIFGRKQFFGFCLVTFTILCVSMLTGFFPLWLNLPINVLIPIYILAKKKMVMFEKLKLSTLIVMRVLIILVLFGLMSSRLYMDIVLIFLIINILEATFTDLLKNKMYYNFVSGLALTASVLFLGARWTAGVTGPLSGLYTTFVSANAPALFRLGDVHLWATIAWIVAYTIWNWVFVIGEFSPSVSYLHVGILASPIISCLFLWNPGYWLLMRANSLTFGGVFQIAYKDQVEKRFANEKMSRFVTWVKTKPVQIVLMVLNLLLLAYTAVVFFA